MTKLSHVMQKEDATVLREIMAALDAIGSQLDAADHIRDYDPWSKITGLAIVIQSQLNLLSEQFSAGHSNLLARLSESAGLHLAWGDLLDEIEQVLG